MIINVRAEISLTHLANYEIFKLREIALLIGFH